MVEHRAACILQVRSASDVLLYTTDMVFKNRHYFDSGSFTPISKKASAVVQCIIGMQTKQCLANPLAVHESGRKAREYLEHARTMVARLYQIKAENVIFTSGATEANLVAIRTAILHAVRRGISLSDVHIVVGDDEHSSVYKNISYFQTLGVQYTVASPQNGSHFQPSDVTKHIHKNTIAVSLQLVNSRHGAVQPIADIARACRNKHPSVLVHTDAAQGTAYSNCSPVSLGVDMATIDSAKCFGPQGVGALVFQKAHLYSGLEGEHSIQDIRPGTPSVALVYGFAVALKELHEKRRERHTQAQHIRNYLAVQIKNTFPDATVHGINKVVKDVRVSDWKKVAPHLLYISFPNTNHAYLATLLDTHGFAVSTGSACSEPVESAIRFGVLPTTTERSVRKLVACLKEQIALAGNS